MRIWDWSSDVCSSDLQAVTPGPHFNAKAARAKLMARSGSEDGKYEWGPGVAKEDRAHGDDRMTCFTCHLSWTTSCGGCHLPIAATWKTKRSEARRVVKECDSTGRSRWSPYH